MQYETFWLGGRNAVRWPFGLATHAERSATALADASPRYGVLVTAGPRLSADGALDQYLRLPFSQPAHTLLEAVSRLRKAQDHVGDASRTSVPVL